MVDYKGLAAQRLGGSRANLRQGSSGGSILPGGLEGSKSQGNWSIAPTPGGGTSVPGAMPAPGVTGVTPGAIQRRVGNPTPPSMQAQQGGGGPVAPMRAAAALQNPAFQQQPNLQGPARAELNAPVGNLENFLRNLQNRRSQE